VAGRPFTEGVTENVQLVAFLTEAVNVTEPPVAISEVGVTLKDLTVGFGDAASVGAAMTMVLSVATATAPRKRFVVRRRC
jgi:hypothetical protein